MPFHSDIEPLLELQETDIAIQKMEVRLKALPQEVQGALTKISRLQEELEAARQKVKDLEITRRQLDTELEQTEEKVIKLKNQQISVKKNEEYEALNREIEMAREKVGELEERGLEILEELDREKEVLAGRENETRDAIGVVEQEIAQHKEQEKKLRKEKEELEKAREEQRGRVGEEFLARWDKLTHGKIKYPLIVPAAEKKCGGCFMRISNEVESRLLAGKREVFCDHCGRWLYRD